MADKKKHLKQFAKKLVAMSLDADGQASSERVSAVLETLGQQPPRAYKLLLKLYAKHLETEMGRGTALIEYAGPLPQSEIAAVEQQFTQQYHRKIVASTKENPALIAGVRITVGDDVYDASIAARLAQLELNVS